MHVMLDLETLGTGPNASVLSIGALAFDRHGEISQHYSQYYRNLGIDEQLRRGAEVDDRTLRFWLGQSEEARKALMPEASHPAPVLAGFAGFLGVLSRVDGEAPVLWSNGAAFDIPILESMYRRFENPIPWDYRKVRCYRTVCQTYEGWLGERNIDPCDEGAWPADAPGTAHNAMDDCRRQVRILVSCLEKMHLPLA